MKLYNNELTNNVPGFQYWNDHGINPTIYSQESEYQIQFAQTRDSLRDVEVYRRFIDNAEAAFRHSIMYKQYKGTLMDMGMDRCQVHGNITADMATIEMHHNILTLFDITYIITEHLLNTLGYVTTFDVIYLLKMVHAKHKVQLVMLSLTPHQLYHNEEGMFIHPSMCFGDWISFLYDFNKGITLDIANKVIMYIDYANEVGGTLDGNLLELKKTLIDWSLLNERISNGIIE